MAPDPLTGPRPGRQRRRALDTVVLALVLGVLAAALWLNRAGLREVLATLDWSWAWPIALALFALQMALTGGRSIILLGDRLPAQPMFRLAALRCHAMAQASNTLLPSMAGDVVVKAGCLNGLTGLGWGRLSGLMLVDRGIDLIVAVALAPVALLYLSGAVGLGGAMALAVTALIAAPVAIGALLRRLPIPASAQGVAATGSNGLGGTRSIGEDGLGDGGLRGGGVGLAPLPADRQSGAQATETGTMAGNTGPGGQADASARIGTTQGRGNRGDFVTAGGLDSAGSLGGDAGTDIDCASTVPSVGDRSRQWRLSDRLRVLRSSIMAGLGALGTLYRQTRRRLLGAYGVTLLRYACYGGVLVALSRAILDGTDTGAPAIAVMALGVALAQLALALPLAPGGIGLQEGAWVAILTASGHPVPDALAFAVAFRLFLLTATALTTVPLLAWRPGVGARNATNGT